MSTAFQRVVDDLTEGDGCACHTGTGYNSACRHCQPQMFPEASDAPAVNLISMEAANRLARSHVRSALTTLHDHFDTNQRYSGDYIRRQIRELRLLESGSND